jgi:hypothetical protein
MALALKVLPVCSALSLSSLSANPLGVHLPFTSSFPWLVVALPLIAPPLPLPLVLTMFRLLLLSSCCATSTSCCLEAPPAFKSLPPLCPLAPPPLLPLICRLIFAKPFVVPPLSLVLLMLRRLLSADAFPPFHLLFTRWLSCCPFWCIAASSCSINALPPLVHFSSWLPLVCRLVVMLHLVAPPLPCVTFCHAATSPVHP